jgi:tripartite-type tricarboxylate transporter receptor subunit TctC
VHTAHAATGSASRDEAYPSKPVRLLVGYPPGGGGDDLARMLAQKLGERLGRPVVIDNRPGATGNLAASLTAQAAPDGYTLLFAPSSHPIQGLLKAKLPYHPVKDFAPVAQFVNYRSMLVISPSVPATNLAQLVALAKAKPGQLNFGSAGFTSGSHLAAELLKYVAAIDIVHVPYKGNAPAITDMLGGRLQMLFPIMLAVIPLAKAGKLRPLAITGSGRAEQMPEVPTVVEAGYPEYHFNPWYGVLAPAATPRALIDRLNREINAIGAQPDNRQRLIAEATEPVSSTPDGFARNINTEVAKWQKVFKQIGIRPE